MIPLRSDADGEVYYIPGWPRADELGPLRQLEGDKIPIDTPQDLSNIKNKVAVSYILMADIDLAGYCGGRGWEPIGNMDKMFTGTLLLVIYMGWPPIPVVWRG